MDNRNDDFLYGAGEQPEMEYEEPVVQDDVEVEIEVEPQVSEPEVQQIPPYGQEAFNQNQYYQNQNGYNPYPQNGYNPFEQPAPKKTLGIVSLVIGILSILCCCLPAVVSIVLGIVAIVTGILSITKKENAKGFAIWGIVLGSLAIFLGIVGIIISAYMVSTGVYEDIMNEFSQSMGLGDSLYSDFPSDLDF